MVFLIQNAQNRESTALQLKLDELIRVTDARNKLVGIEQLSEPELETLRDEIRQRKVAEHMPPSPRAIEAKRVQSRTLMRRWIVLQKIAIRKYRSTRETSIVRTASAVGHCA
jgi:low affinity Fe/Cu permease